MGVRRGDEEEEEGTTGIYNNYDTCFDSDVEPGSVETTVDSGEISIRNFSKRLST